MADETSNAPEQQAAPAASAPSTFTPRGPRPAGGPGRRASARGRRSRWPGRRTRGTQVLPAQEGLQVLHGEDRRDLLPGCTTAKIVPRLLQGIFVAERGKIVPRRLSGVRHAHGTTTATAFLKLAMIGKQSREHIALLAASARALRNRF